MRISDWSSDVCSSDLDLGMAAAAFMIALLLRLGDEAWRSLMTELWPPMLLFTAVCGIVFLTTGLYRGVWRYASMNDLVAIVKAVSLSLAVFLPVTFLITRLDSLPPSWLVITWFVLIFLPGPPARQGVGLGKGGSVRE